MKTARELLCILGFAALICGLVGYDWRTAAIVGGSVLLVGTLYAMTWIDK